MISLRRRRIVLGAGASSLGGGFIPYVFAQTGRRSPPTASRKGTTPAVPADDAKEDGIAQPRAATVLWDGASGVTSQYFNRGALLPWENKGGDWTDAAGVAQGTRTYGMLMSSAPGGFSAETTELVRRWYAKGNTGAYLRASGAATIALRANEEVAKRPLLVLISASGARTEVVCSGSGVMDVGTAYAAHGGSYSLGDGKHLALQFELPHPQPEFVSAHLYLTSTFNYSTPLKLNVYALRPPTLCLGGAPTMGLAAKYPRDAGIDKDPDVYFSGFDKTNFPEGGVAADKSAAADPQFPEVINAVYNVGYFSACTLNHRWSTKRAGLPTRNPNNGLIVREELPSAQYFARANAQCPEEVYFRYYLKLRRDYQCNVEGKKLPGIAGRYGRWSGDDRSGHYETDAGNGGNPTTGDFDGKLLNGWSLRHHAYQSPPDMNPLRDWIPLNYYAYFVGMGNGFGQYWRWGNPRIGFANLEAEQWYCIEHYAKINSLSGPYDANGNGVPVADGVVRGWLDGVLMFERTDVVLRKHPAIRIDEIWFDHYHGGTKPAEAQHHFSMAAVVVARQYIGPLSRG